MVTMAGRMNLKRKRMQKTLSMPLNERKGKVQCRMKSMMCMLMNKVLLGMGSKEYKNVPGKQQMIL